MDGKGRRIPPGMAGAEQELNSGIIGLPVFQHFCFSQCCRGSEGSRLEGYLGLPEREGGWREVWDCLRGKEAGGTFGISWEGRRLEGHLGLPERKGGWREVWDAPGLKVHRQAEVSPVLSAVPALFTSQVHLAPGFRGNCQDKWEHSQLGLNVIFPKFSPEKVPHVYTTGSWLS